MIVLAIIGSGIVAAAQLQAAAVQPRVARDDNRFSECTLSKIAELEGTTADKLAGFSRKDAQKALASCQGIKAVWAADMDRKFQSDPQLSDLALRKAAVSRIIGEDEAAMMLVIGLKAK